MSYQKAYSAYVDLYGGFPEFLFMGASEDYILPFILKALKTGKEIEPPHEDEDILY